MASSTHLDLAAFVKSVHLELRINCQLWGPEEAWRKHCMNQNHLDKYATAMHSLAKIHWDNNCKKGLKAVSRVTWILEFIDQYFHKGGLLEKREKEFYIAKQGNIDVLLTNSILPDTFEECIKVLDVGSCYNPFRSFGNLDVVAIDIAPATPDVQKCDFLSVDVSNDLVHSKKGPLPSMITSFQINSFDVVLFSLFLEYLPSSSQRLLCCSKAYQLLKTEGVLIIITPDSKHVGANSKIIKSWQFVLAKLGFSRIKYEKLPHLHCMAFRKSLNGDIPRRWANIQNEKKFYSEIHIPQDFKTSKVVSGDFKMIYEKCDPSLFDELPSIDYN